MRSQQEFMMIFRFSPDFTHRPSEQEINEMQKQWGHFIGNLAIAEKLVSTNRLGFVGKQIQPDLTVSEGIASPEGKTISGYLVAKAQSIDEATELAKECPILKMNGTVEVRSIEPMEPQS